MDEMDNKYLDAVNNVKRAEKTLIEALTEAREALSSSGGVVKKASTKLGAQKDE